MDSRLRGNDRPLGVQGAKPLCRGAGGLKNPSQGVIQVYRVFTMGLLESISVCGIGFMPAETKQKGACVA